MSAHVILIGNLGRKPEIKADKNGKNEVRFSIAVSNGKDQDPTWYSGSRYGDYAEKLAATLDKGDRVLVRGNLTQKVADGKVYNNVRIEQIDYIGAKKESNEF